MSIVKQVLLDAADLVEKHYARLSFISGDSNNLRYCSTGAILRIENPEASRADIYNGWGLADNSPTVQWFGKWLAQKGEVKDQKPLMPSRGATWNVVRFNDDTALATKVAKKMREAAEEL